MSARGGYAIVHGDNQLITYQHGDMDPSGWGWRLAKEAGKSRDSASEVGEASTKVGYCEWADLSWPLEIDPWEPASVPEAPQAISQTGVVPLPLPPSRWPRVARYRREVGRPPPHGLPSFLGLAAMKEVHPGFRGDPTLEYHYTWVTYPRNLFVAGAEWPEPVRRKDAGYTLVWDLENQERLDHLAGILVDGDTFENALFLPLD